MAQPCKFVKNVAARASTNLVGFDPTIIIAIISALLPLLKGCFNPPSTGATKKYVTDHYKKGKYGPAVLNATTKQVFQAWRDAGADVKRKRDRDEAQTLATATLDEIRLGDAATLQEAMNKT